MAHYGLAGDLDNDYAMGRMRRFALRHRAAITVVVLLALFFNLSLMPHVERGDPAAGDLPIAARCHGGGPGCVEQPLVPPPALGLPRIDAIPPAHVVLVRMTLATTPEPPDVAPVTLDPPPEGA